LSLLKSVGKAVKKVAKGIGKVAKVAAPIAASFLPGPLGTVASLVAGGGSVPNIRTLPGGTMANSILQGIGYAGDVYAQRLPVPRAPTLPRTMPQTRPAPGPGGGPVLRPGETQGRIRIPGAARNKLTPWGWLPKVGRRAAELAGWLAIGQYWYDQVSGSVVAIKFTRRMNPLNARALRRAIRRVKGATRICREVERITAPRRGGARSRRGSARAEAACR